MSVDAFDNVGDHFDGSGDHYYFQSGVFPDLRDLPDGPDMNDKTSLLTVHDYSSVFFSTDDPSVPSDFSVDLNNGTFHVHLSFGGGQYHKIYDYDVLVGCTPVWHEATKDGVAGRTVNFNPQTRKFHIDLWVAMRGPGSARNWIGVDFSCAPALPVERTRHTQTPRVLANSNSQLRESPP
jgi:hypothetical protein